jgi:hypothetical protein
MAGATVSKIAMFDKVDCHNQSGSPPSGRADQTLLVHVRRRRRGIASGKSGQQP